ncbi:MAG: GNAT family N-acetyltransferase [Pseudomonadota bacterium]
MTVRRAVVMDAPELEALHLTLFPEGPWDRGFWRQAMERPSDAVLVIGQPPRGFALVRAAADEAELLTIGTAIPGQGDGWALVTASAKAALDLGAERLFLEVSAANRSALGLYSRMGFVRLATRPGYYRDGSDAEVMALNLRRQED